MNDRMPGQRGRGRLTTGSMGGGAASDSATVGSVTEPSLEDVLAQPAEHVHVADQRQDDSEEPGDAADAGDHGDEPEESRDDTDREGDLRRIGDPDLRSADQQGGGGQSQPEGDPARPPRAL